ncbi:MAG: hypothetical protein QM767_21995 [Anaeromyxobacter sp.]
MSFTRHVATALLLAAAFVALFAVVARGPLDTAASPFGRAQAAAVRR